MIEFAYPWAFLLLVLPIVVRLLAPVFKEHRDAVQVPFFDRLVALSGQTPQPASVINRRKKIQAVLLAFAWLCLVFAIAKPEQIGEPIVQQKSARDLMIAVDLSGSMAAQDFVTENGQTLERLTAVKQVLHDFVMNRQHDRLGLVLFADAAYLQAPFTDDLSTWLQLLNEAQLGMAGQSTALGDAIGLALSVFNNTNTEHKVLIVLTDGNDTGSRVPPIEAAKLAASFGIKVYTIAIGDPQTQGEDKLNLEVLQQVSVLTGGETFQAMNQGELLQVYQQIDRLEPQMFETQSFRPRTSLHHYPIVLFMLTYIVVLLIVSVRRLRQEKWN